MGILKVNETPMMKLMERVKPRESQVKVKPRVVHVRLVKVKRGLWPRITEVKYAWIRRDSELGSISDSEEEKSMQRMEDDVVHMCRVGDKHYHPETGEQVLPEGM